MYPNLEASTNAKKLPPKEIQYGIVTPSTSTVRLSLYKKAGTFVKVTSTAFPFSTFTFVRIIPAGASNTTSVYGSVTGTRPVSTATVAEPIVPCPHIFKYPPVSMKITPRSASSLIGSVKIAPNIS